MNENIYGLKDPTNEALVEVIRREFLLEADTNPHLYHPIDVERCRTEDWQTERFLIEKGTPEEALKALKKSMQWKKSFGVHERDRHYFPTELYMVFCVEKPNITNQGHICFWSSPRNYRKIAEFSELFRQFVVYYYEHFDRFVGSRGYISIGDVGSVSLRNADLQLAILYTQILEYYPGTFLKGYIVDLSGPLVTLWNIVQRLLSQTIRDRAITIKKQDLSDCIDLNIDEIPVSFGGNREKDNDLNAGLLPLSQCKHLDFTDKQIENFYKTFNFL